MLVKFKPELKDTEAEAERQKYIFGTRRSIAAIAVKFEKGKIWVYLDISSTLVGVPLRILDVVDDSLSKTWRVNVLANDTVLLGPELLAQDFEVDSTERSPSQAVAYAEIRRTIFAEAERVDPEAWRVRDP